MTKPSPDYMRGYYDGVTHALSKSNVLEGKAFDEARDFQMTAAFGGVRKFHPTAKTLSPSGKPLEKPRLLPDDWDDLSCLEELWSNPK